MKILFSITYYCPYVSGLSIAVKRLAEALVKRGFKPTVLCMQHEKILKPEERTKGVRIMRARPWLAASKGFLSWEFVRLAWQLVKETETVVVNLPQLEGLIPALLAKIFGKRLIAIYHCEVVLPEGFINTIIQSFLEISNFLTLLMADQVVTYTGDFAKHSKLLKSLKELKKDQKILTVYPPIPAPRISLAVRKRLKEEIGEADILIGVAARLAAEKGLEYLFEATTLLKFKIQHSTFKIAVAGPKEPVGEEAYKQKIIKLAKKYKKQTVFLGSLPEEEMGAFYSLIDVLVLPSVNSTEAFGMVQVEAMYGGVPAVVSNLPGVRVPVAKTGMGIIVEPKNSQAIAEAISEVIKHKERYVKDKDVIAGEFSLAKTLDFYAKLFSSPEKSSKASICLR